MMNGDDTRLESMVCIISKLEALEKGGILRIENRIIGKHIMV